MQYRMLDETDTVVNIIEWDGESNYSPPAGTTLEENDSACAIGWTRVNGVFVAPVDPNLESNLLSSVNSIRDTRIVSGFEHNGVVFQSAPADQDNISGAATSALAWLSMGGSGASLRWADPTKDFGWIARDNSLVPMTAPQMLGFFGAGLRFKASQIYFARALKDAIIAADTPEAKQALFDAASWPS